MALEILSLFNQIGYREYVQYLSEHDAVMICDFPKLQISEMHLLDMRCCFKDGKFNLNHVLEIFAKYSDMEVDDL